MFTELPYPRNVLFLTARWLLVVELMDSGHTESSTMQFLLSSMMHQQTFLRILLNGSMSKKLSDCYRFITYRSCSQVFNDRLYETDGEDDEFIAGSSLAAQMQAQAAKDRKRQYSYFGPHYLTWQKIKYINQKKFRKCRKSHERAWMSVLDCSWQCWNLHISSSIVGTVLSVPLLRTGSYTAGCIG